MLRENPGSDNARPSCFAGPAVPQGAAAELVPAGSYPARCKALIDLGWRQEEFTDPKTKATRKSWLRKVLLCWELLGAPSPNAAHGPILSRDYTLAFSPAAKLRQLMEALRGRSYADHELIDPAKLIDQPCLITVVHKAGQRGPYAKIDAIAPAPAGLTVPRRPCRPSAAPRAPGRPASLSCMLRWVLDGARGPSGERVRLEAARLGGRWVTSLEALRRFSERLTPSVGGDDPAAPRSAASRRRASEQAAVEPDKIGL